MDLLWGISNIAKLVYSCTVGTCEFFLAAVPHALLQILQLMFHLLVLPLCLLALPPEQIPQKQHVCHERRELRSNYCSKTLCNWPAVGFTKTSYYLWYYSSGVAWFLM